MFRYIKTRWINGWIERWVVAQSLSRVWLFVTPWTAARQTSLSFNIFWSLLKLTSIKSVMSSCSSSSPFPPAFSLSHHEGLFQWAGSLHQVAKLLGIFQVLLLGISKFNSVMSSYWIDVIIIMNYSLWLYSLFRNQFSLKFPYSDFIFPFINVSMVNLSFFYFWPICIFIFNVHFL